MSAHEADVQERRKFKRVDTRGLLKVERYPLPPDHKGDLVNGIVRNLSAGGALFCSQQSFSVGEFLALELDTASWSNFQKDYQGSVDSDESSSLNLLAKVVRVEIVEPEKNFDVGVCFVAVDDGRQWELVRLIEKSN